MSGSRRDRLGWFGPFMDAWGRADAATRAQIEAAVQSYAQRLITGATLERRVSELLGLPSPMPWLGTRP